MIPLIATEKEKLSITEDLCVVLHPYDGEREATLLDIYSRGPEMSSIQWSNEIVDGFVSEIIHQGKPVDMTDKKPSQLLRVAQKRIIVDRVVEVQRGVDGDDKKK